MASITIRNLDEETKRRLKIRAAERNRSMEEEVRNILCAALAEEEPSIHLVDSIRSRFVSLGGVDLDIPAREPVRMPPNFGA